MTEIETLLAAKHPHEVFGESPGFYEDPDDAKAEIHTIYKRIAAKVHPDVCDDPRAEEAMVALNRFVAQAARAIVAGSYGDEGAVLETVVLTTKRHIYEVTDFIAEGEVANIYFAKMENGDEAVLKVARDPVNNMWVANEAARLKTILSDKDTFDQASVYLPGYIETFGYKLGGKNRQANVFSRVDGLVSLEEVRMVYEDGVHPKHMAWMMRRILMALGYAHAQGIVHGAVTPAHVLIHPEQHGLVLVDWKAATTGDKMLELQSEQYKDFYPPWAFTKKATPALDIYMAVECMKYVIGKKEMPTALKAFFNGSQLIGVPSAWDLKDEFDELLESLWGPRKFLPFSMSGH